MTDKPEMCVEAERLLKDVFTLVMLSFAMERVNSESRLPALYLSMARERFFAAEKAQKAADALAKIVAERTQ
jgi:hypothetical protein